jgi:hypothetical protein
VILRSACPRSQNRCIRPLWVARTRHQR